MNASDQLLQQLNQLNAENSGLSYYLRDFWVKYEDPRMSGLPLMGGGPWMVIFISLLYILFCTKIGPAYMKNREPFDLRSLMLHYNSILIGVNGVGTFIGLWITHWGWDTWNCTQHKPNVNDYRETLIVYLGFCFVVSKFFDFGDTIFFVLRKKHNQVTFLHLFHHGIMPLGCCLGLKFHPVAYSGFMPIINAFIHALMYSYYSLACAGQDLKPYLTWKKQLTQAQMIQFILIFIHAGNALLNPVCRWPLTLTLLELVHAVLFFFLFYSFYRAAYGAKKLRQASMDVNGNEMAKPTKQRSD